MVRRVARILRDTVLHEWRCAFITAAATTHTAPAHAMDAEGVTAFTRYIGQLCAQREIDIYRLAERLTMDPTELLKMINGKLAPTHAALSGLARELDIDVRYLERLAEDRPVLK
jgi:hypothetical protein